ncbi:MAG TPA: tetratricopeptide repeat protein [Cyclobacteriaceae bacterium]|nr:tetratricopeptide repeat protein [Cyclobacteriaceae bacterium]
MKVRYVIILLLITAENGFAQNQLSQTKAERLYAKGMELVQHGNFGAARETFSEFLSASSSHDSRRAEAQYYVAFSALNLGHEDGEKLIDHFIENNPSSPRASTAYYDLAMFLYNEKSYVKASQYFKKVDFPALTNDQESQGHFSYGYSLFNQKKLDESLEQFNFVKKQSNSFSPAASYYAGYIEFYNGKYDEALADLRRAEANPSYKSIVPHLIANIYYRQQKYNELLEYAESLKSRTDVINAKDIAMLVAEAEYFKGDYKKAIASYEKYFEGSPDKAPSPLLYRVGHAYYTQGQEDKAVNYLKRAAASTDTVSYYASYYLGILYLKQGNKPYALNSFDYARKYKDDKRLWEESSFQYAKVAYDAGKSEQAINELEVFLKAFPSSAHESEVRELLAQAYVNGNNYNKAIEYIESLPKRSITMDRAYQKATYLKGSELFNKEDYPGAVEAFEKSLAFPIDQQYVVLASFWNAEAYSIGRKFENAAEHYLTVVGLGAEADPEILIKSRYGLGYAFYNIQAYDRALFNFKEFVNKTTRANPNHTDALIRLADCYYVAKSYPEALDYYSRARDIGSPDNDYILLQTGVISGILRKYDDARSQLTSLISSYPKSPYRDDALFQRAQFEIEQGNYQQSIEGLSQLIRELPGSPFIPYAYTRRAASAFNLKQYDRTINDYSYVLREYPTHPVAQDVLLPLQEALNLAGRSDEFDKYLAGFKRANPENKGLESVEYETAKNLFFSQQYQKAIVSLNSFVASYPQSANVSEAKYYIAESHYRLKEFDKAIVIYEELSNDMTLNMGNKVVSRMAEIDFKQGRYEKAVNSFHKLERMAGNKKDLFTAWSGLMESFYLLAKYDSVITYANTILEKGNVNASAQNKATLYLGKAAMSKGDFETAQDEFINTLNTARDEYGAEAKYHLAEIFYQKKDYKQCYETCVSLNNDFSAYDEWVGKSFLLLADNFIAMGDVFQAKATLQSLIDNFPIEHIKNEAKIKLADIKEVRKEVEGEEMTFDSLENNH